MIQYALKELLGAGLLSRRLRGSESTAYQVNWSKLSEIAGTFEIRANDRDEVVSPRERRGRGRKKLQEGGAKDCVYEVQGIAPKLNEENTRKKDVFPVGSESAEPDPFSDNTTVEKLLSIQADHAFLAALDREVRGGRRFASDVAEKLYERLELIHGADDAHARGDPIAGRAYRLLETELTREAS